ncbi:MAG: SprT-like domain-containing protein [Calditerrivibrio sp.]|nr:SprT-like domain-containing protein [Calditerrivibrio sp.]
MMKILEHKILEICRSVQRLFGFWLLDEVVINFNLKGRSAGKYIPARSEIRLNAELLERYPEIVANDILIHEVAHHIVFRLYKKSVKPHGAEWKEICRKLDYEPRVYHDLPVKNSKVFKRDYIYGCKCMQYRFTSIRHNKAQRGIVYYCKKCQNRLRFVKIDKVEC